MPIRNLRNGMAKRSAEKRFELMLEGAVYDLGSLQHKVLTSVVEKNYDEALSTLKGYRERKSFYQSYVKKTGKIFDHAENLIHSIKIKKNFPNLQGLNQKKQEELAQKTKEHWEELRIVLRRLNTIEKDMEVEDARSTVLVVRALMVATMIILCAFIINEAVLSFGITFKMLMTDLKEVFKYF